MNILTMTQEDIYSLPKQSLCWHSYTKENFNNIVLLPEKNDQLNTTRVPCKAGNPNSYGDYPVKSYFDNDKYPKINFVSVMDEKPLFLYETRAEIISLFSPTQTLSIKDRIKILFSGIKIEAAEWKVDYMLNSGCARIWKINYPNLAIYQNREQIIYITDAKHGHFDGHLTIK